MIFTASFNPVALQLGPIAIHWYALAYVAGFLLGASYLKLLIKTKALPLAPELLDDFMTYAILGVLLGGRLGYVLFYDLPAYAADPVKALYIWQGGMSFHGGLMGVIAAILLFAYRKKLNPFFVGDLIAAAGPIGLFFGRITNFINGELWGRPTGADWGVIFPAAGDGLPRHPSQLYEAGLEGLLLFSLLWLLAFRSDSIKHPGRISGVFLIGYAASRFAIEFVREPDKQLGFLYAGATMGQLLCIPMALFGAWVFLRSFRHHHPS